MGRVVVFGSINMDCVTKVLMHPKPGETVPGKDLCYYPGGKGANQAVASSRLGADTTLIGCVGTDGFGNFMLNFLKNENINVEHINKEEGATGTAFIAVDQNGENTIIVIPGANGMVSPHNFESIKLNEDDILVCQNEIPVAALQGAFHQAKTAKAKIIYNPAPAISVPDELFNVADIVVVNETEHKVYAPQFRKGSSVIIETRGAEGVAVTTPERSFDIPGHDVSVIDTTGAGDCFTGALAAGLCANYPLERAVEFANKAASLSVQKSGAGIGMPTMEEIQDCI